MAKTDKTKLTARIIVQLGTGKIVHTIIRNNVTPEKKIDQITVPAASFVLGGIVAESASKYTDRLVDEVRGLVNAVKQLKNDQ
jgi:hypothetical protein